MAGLSANLQRLVISQLLENKRNLLLVNLTSSWQKSSSRQGPNLTEIFSQKQISRYQAKKCSAEDGRHHLVKSDSGSTRRRFSAVLLRSEEHTSELQSLMRISYAVFCLKKKKPTNPHNNTKR